MRTGSSEQMKAVLKYPGAKNRLAEWICNYIPKHDVYLEPYAGSLAVFFAKQPVRIETLNDLDGNVVNYFRVIRDKPQELIEKLSLTPYARGEYNTAFEQSKTDSEVEMARKFAVRCWQGFAVELLKRYNTPDVFMYVDPPYLHGTRKNYLYRYEMENTEHVELLEILAGHPGKVLLSGYDNDLYNSYLSGWKKVQKKTQAEAGLPRTETLWMNYKTDQMDIWDFI